MEPIIAALKKRDYIEASICIDSIFRLENIDKLDIDALKTAILRYGNCDIFNSNITKLVVEDIVTICKARNYRLFKAINLRKLIPADYLKPLKKLDLNAYMVTAVLYKFDHYHQSLCFSRMLIHKSPLIKDLLRRKYHTKKYGITSKACAYLLLPSHKGYLDFCYKYYGKPVMESWIKQYVDFPYVLELGLIKLLPRFSNQMDLSKIGYSKNLDTLQAVMCIELPQDANYFDGLIGLFYFRKMDMIAWFWQNYQHRITVEDLTVFEEFVNDHLYVDVVTWMFQHMESFVEYVRTFPHFHTLAEVEDETGPTTCLDVLLNADIQYLVPLPDHPRFAAYGHIFQ